MWQNHKARKARVARRRALFVGKRVEKEIQRRDAAREGDLVLGIDAAGSGSERSSVVLARAADDKIEIVDQIIFTPPACKHTGGSEPCVPECVMIYGPR